MLLPFCPLTLECVLSFLSLQPADYYVLVLPKVSPRWWACRPPVVSAGLVRDTPTISPNLDPVSLCGNRRQPLFPMVRSGNLTSSVDDIGTSLDNDTSSFSETRAEGQSASLLGRLGLLQSSNKTTFAFALRTSFGMSFRPDVILLELLVSIRHSTCL